MSGPARCGRARTPRLRVAIVDTGVNSWHSHVRGRVTGCRVYVSEHGTIEEDDDFRDLAGHGTAVAGVLREALPSAELFAIRVFDAQQRTYPSLVARAIVRAAAHGCDYVNLSLAVPPGVGEEALRWACAEALDAGCVLVASAPPQHQDWLPACVPGVRPAAADDSLAPGVVRAQGAMLFARGHPRDLPGLPPQANLWGHSFACARALAHLALSRRRAGGGAT